MSAILNLISLTLASGDATANNNPALKFVEWKRQVLAIPVNNPKTEAVTIDPGAEKLIFDGTRATTLDGTTAFSLSLSPLASDRYRFTFSAGTDPSLRLARSVPIAGVALTLVVNTNGSLTVTAGSGTPFSAVMPGDHVFIPGASTGDLAGPFMLINQGLWQVLGTSSTVLTLVRPGQDFEALSEVVTPASNAEFLVYAAAGVQPGDKVEISSGFNTLKTFEVSTVTSKWFEVISTNPMAAQAGVIPGAAGLQFYSSSKRFVRIEADQECVVRANGDTGSTQRISPWLAGDPEKIAEYTKVGPMWALRILNRSSATLHCTIISAE